ncbi:MAG: hypothetical protein WC911_01940 [Thermoleophilia bacterium]
MELSSFQGLERIGLEQVGAALESATWRTAQWMRNQWADQAQRMGVHDTGAYLRGIREDGMIVPVSSNLADPSAAMFAVVLDVVNTAKHAQAVEEGSMAFHMPDRVDWARSGRVKVSKKGVPYIHVPFRHYTHAASGSTATALRSMMTKEITAEAKTLDRRLALGAGFQHTPEGQFVAVDKYRWAGLSDKKRITRPGASVGDPEWRGAKHVAFGMVNPAWKSSKYEGLMKTDPEKHTNYMTIRTMTRDSPGWNIPAKAGKWVARTTAQITESSDEVKKTFETAFAKAILKVL